MLMEAALTPLSHIAAIAAFNVRARAAMASLLHLVPSQTPCFSLPVAARMPFGARKAVRVRYFRLHAELCGRGGNSWAGNAA